MKFLLDALIAAESDEDTFLSAKDLINADAIDDQIGDITLALGRLAAHADGKELFGDYTADPIVRLVDGWLKKLPWIIGGDTETVALRNSEQCFAFVPAGDSVEVSFFVGSEAEIEDYVLEPTVVRLEMFVEQSLALGRLMLDLVAAVDPSLLESNEDCRDLQTSFTEADRAWHDHQLHQRR